MAHCRSVLLLPGSCCVLFMEAPSFGSSLGDSAGLATPCKFPVHASAGIFPAGYGIVRFPSCFTHRSTIFPNILVTAALPYANGSLHVGHLLGYIQADAWVRARRQAGQGVDFICADDTHGTPIALAAAAANLPPEEYIARVHAEHARDFADFHVAFDRYGSTHAPSNRQLTNVLFERLQSSGNVVRKTISQLYDPQEQCFLPDRYVRGGCPTCAAPDQYGDNCEVCGAVYSASELVRPRSVLSGATPQLKDTEHLFFRVSGLGQSVQAWLAKDTVPAGVNAKLGEWFASPEGLRDWDITRDAPYFGFPIPGEVDKFFYVWVDAPIGYLSTYLDYRGLPAAQIDQLSEVPEIHHFLGKDIINFHGIFWPALLSVAGLPLPTRLHVNGYLTLNGAKLSKSRGNFLGARQYLDAGLPADALRYYLASRSSTSIDDVDLNLAELVEKTNADLVGKIANLASRTARFIHRDFGGRLSDRLPDPGLYQDALEALPAIRAHYEAGDLASVVRAVLALADRANRYLDDTKPWVLAKDPTNADTVQAVCTQALNLFRVIILALAPILPATAQATRRFLGDRQESWEGVATPLLDTCLAPYEPLFTRLSKNEVESLLLS